MANNGKYLGVENGLPKEESAIAVSAGTADAGKIFKLDANGKINLTFFPAGIGTEFDQIIASEALSAGDMVNVYNNAGTLNVRKADNTAGAKPCDGIVLAAYASGATADVYMEETTITGLSGLTPGQDVFGSVTTAGVITTTVPTGAGKVAQLLGKTISATTFKFRRGIPILLA